MKKTFICCVATIATMFAGAVSAQVEETEDIYPHHKESVADIKAEETEEMLEKQHIFDMEAEERIIHPHLKEPVRDIEAQEKTDKMLEKQHMFEMDAEAW